MYIDQSKGIYRGYINHSIEVKMCGAKSHDWTLQLKVMTMTTVMTTVMTGNRSINRGKSQKLNNKLHFNGIFLKILPKIAKKFLKSHKIDLLPKILCYD